MFEIGQECHRRTEIHHRFGGEQQSGISCPKNSPYIFIFMSKNGEEYGYRDEFHGDTFWYTGRGQVGPMQMVLGNKQIRDHAKNGKTIYVFEQTRKAYVRFIGTAQYLGHHTETRPDKRGNSRSAIIFHLDINSSPQTDNVQEYPAPIYTLPSQTSFSKTSLQQLRILALSRPPRESSGQVRTSSTSYRSAALKAYVRKRADGVCEGCGSDAPFSTKDGPFLECHHIFRLADGGPDHPQNVIALCPNCHRRAHYSKDRKAFNDQLAKVSLEVEQRIQKGTDLFSVE